MLLRVSPASPIWVLIPMLAGRSLELVSLYYGQLTAVVSLQIQCKGQVDTVCNFVISRTTCSLHTIVCLHSIYGLLVLTCAIHEKLLCLQHSVLQLPLSLIMAVVLGTRYSACSKHTPGNCVPIAAAPIVVFIEVRIFNQYRAAYKGQSSACMAI